VVVGHGFADSGDSAVVGCREEGRGEGLGGQVTI